MSTWPWPQTEGWIPSRFALRVEANVLASVGQYSGSRSAEAQPGERWRAVLDLPPAVSPAIGAAREAFFDRLKGQLHRVALGHQQLAAPRGSLRGAPVLASPVPALDSIAIVQTAPFATLLAGDLIGIAGQLLRVMADASADAAGRLPVEFRPRARTLLPAGAAVAWSRPEAVFRLAADGGVPTPWTPGMVDGCSIELVEAL